jgi:hypothetical protein
VASGGVGDRCWDFHYLLTTMDRPTHSQARLRIAIVAALVAASAVAAPPALAAATATDEYVLEVPGVGGTDNVSVTTEDGRDRGRAEGQEGVVGEAEPPASPLASAVAMIGSAPAPLLIGAAALLVALVAAAVTRRRSATGRRR